MNKNLIEVRILDEIFPKSTSGWDTSNVTSMEDMFYHCVSLTSLDISGWNTSNVTNMNDMFSDCSSLNEILVGNGWDISKVNNKNSMFTRCGVSEVTIVTEQNKFKNNNSSNE